MIKFAPIRLMTILSFTFVHLFSAAQVEITDSIWHDGMYRSYIMHIPSGYTGTMAFPLVMVLHGGGNGGAQKIIDEHQFDEVADTANYLAVFPKGYENSWADGRGTTDASIAGIDDVSFLNVLIDTLQVDYYLDSNKVYLAGGSNGGMMTQTMACEAPDKFAAFASVISSMPDSLAINCPTTNATNMLLMNGTDDTFIPYEGGTIGVATAGGSVIGTDSTIAFWLAKNGSPNTPDSVSFPDIVTTDNGIVKLFSYPLGIDGSEVVLFKVIGAGHTVPSQLPNWVQIPFLGFVNRDIDGAQQIWKFFSRHCRNEVATLLAIENELTFQLYPNPTKANAKLHFLGNKALSGTITIVDLRGQVVRTVHFKNTSELTLDLSGIQSGSYLVHVASETGSIANQLIIE